MRFLDFEQCKEKMIGQYDSIKEKSDKAALEDLYLEIKRIYSEAPSKMIGKGRANKYFLENVPAFVNEYDIFADLCDVSKTPAGFRREALDEYKKNIGDEEYKKMNENRELSGNADFGHTMPDWKVLLEVGFVGIIERAEKRLCAPEIKDGQRDFYLSVIDSYGGAIAFMKRLAAEASKNPSENTEFVVANLDALTVRAPQTLGEAMQLYFIYYLLQHNVDGIDLRSLGALDELLYPFYRHDIENGICDENEIRQMIRFFLFKWNSMKVTANMPFDLGTHFNELTYLILEEYVSMDIHDPKIHVKCTDDMPERVLKIIMDSIRNGKNSFVFINDSIVQKALAYIGQAAEDAAEYTLIGCYEPASVGKEIPCTCNGRLSLPAAVEKVLGGGKLFVEQNDGASAEFDSFDDFYNEVKRTVAYYCKVSMRAINAVEEFYPSIIQAPVISATYAECMRDGRDAYEGGAKYNNSSICALGIATFVDELLAIKRIVFEEKLVTMNELSGILKNNWQGRERLRKYVQTKCPKYGNNDKEADTLASDIIEFLSENINNKPNARGGVYRLGLFSIDWIFNFIKDLGASADGRLFGEPMSKNLSSSVGMDKKGVTGVVHSVLAQDHSKIPDGAVLDLMIHPSVASGEEGLNILIDLLKMYLLGGGFALQMNIVSADTLRDAQKYPEQYKNLQVRLCGWNVYFADLSQEEQDNLIKSAEGTE